MMIGAVAAALVVIAGLAVVLVSGDGTAPVEVAAAELVYAPVAEPRRIAVVGAGPAGLSTALVPAGRGHAVTLFERDDRIGGQVGLQPLHGDLAVEVGVGRDPHLGHAALTDAAFQLIPVREQFSRGRLRWGWCTGGHDRSSR